jgi:hypothetical protein
MIKLETTLLSRLHHFFGVIDQVESEIFFNDFNL